MKLDINVKESDQWMALNRIWKACSSDQRKALYNDFEIVSNFIISKLNRSPSTNCEDQFRYLDELSPDAKFFVIRLLDNGEPNLYHSIMAVINNNRTLSFNELVTIYFDKFSLKRPYVKDNRILVEEVIELCWRRSHQ